MYKITVTYRNRTSDWTTSDVAEDLKAIMSELRSGIIIKMTILKITD
jgi:hypothetical protein